MATTADSLGTDALGCPRSTAPRFWFGIFTLKDLAVLALGFRFFPLPFVASMRAAFVFADSFLLTANNRLWCYIIAVRNSVRMALFLSAFVVTAAGSVFAQDPQTAYCDYTDGNQVSMQYLPKVKEEP